VTTLITGGAGYIGSITARAIRASGRAVVVLDTLENGHRKAVGDAPFVQGDVADRDLVRRTVEEHGVDEVVHFAAYKAVGESMSNPGKYFANNVAGSQALFGALHDCGVHRVVFSSTAAVYGTPSRVPVTEDDPVRCESVYAETKWMMERTLEWYARTTPLRSVRLRYFNAAGASDDASLGENWTGVRDYIHVEDLAAAHIAALDHLAGGGDSVTLNVGTGQGTSVLEIIAATERVTGTRVPHQIVGRRPGDVSEVWADASRIRDLTGWEPRRTLDDIIATAHAWHSARPAGHAS